MKAESLCSTSCLCVIEFDLKRLVLSKERGTVDASLTKLYPQKKGKSSEGWYEEKREEGEDEMACHRLTGLT